MKINLSGHHVDLTTPLRDYVNSKMERLERHFDHVTDTHVVLSVEKLRHKAEATMHITGGNIFADAEQENMYAAIDSLVDKLTTSPPPEQQGRKRQSFARSVRVRREPQE